MTRAPSGELESASLVWLTVERLQREILSGELEPGTRLIEEQLTRELGISRAPVREALRHLAEQGLVEHLPRRGARVARLSDRDFDELFAVRDALERFAVDQALKPTRRPDLSGPRAELQRMADAVAAGDELGAGAAHRAFHLAVVALADSHQLLLTYEPVIVKLQLYMAANLHRETAQASGQAGIARHKRLLTALASGDGDRVRRELDRHGARRYFR